MKKQLKTLALRTTPILVVGSFFFAVSASLVTSTKSFADYRTPTEPVNVLRHACLMAAYRNIQADFNSCSLAPLLSGNPLNFPRIQAELMCASVRALVILGDPLARDAEQLVCTLSFSNHDRYANGQLVYQESSADSTWSVFYSNGAVAADQASNGFYSDKAKAWDTRMAYYNRGQKFCDGVNWYYPTGSLLRSGDNIYFGNGRTAASSQGRFTYDDGDDGGYDDKPLYPENIQASINGKAVCPDGKPPVTSSGIRDDIITFSCSAFLGCSNFSHQSSICYDWHIFENDLAIRRGFAIQLLQITADRYD